MHGTENPVNIILDLRYILENKNERFKLIDIPLRSKNNDEHKKTSLLFPFFPDTINIQGGDNVKRLLLTLTGPFLFPHCYN